MVALSTPRSGSHRTLSSEARVTSLASLSRRARRRLSRSVHSRSTTMPSFSSKESWWPGAVSISSRTASAMLVSRSSCQFRECFFDGGQCTVSFLS